VRNATVSKAVANIDPANYEEAYDHLYDNHGYHSDSEFTHELPTVFKLCGFAKTAAPPIHSVLVLGCSHGKGVATLHQNGFNAYGIDVASKAIAMAKQLRGSTCLTEGTVPCFQEGSLTALPYQNWFVDAGLSVDVLEHIAPHDVPLVVSEISRVVKHYLFLSIANFPEMSKSGEKAGMKNVHLTVEGASWWSAQFAKGGWYVLEDTSTEMQVNLVLGKR